MVTHVWKNKFARIDAARQIQQCWPHLKVHAFGMANGEIGELRPLEWAGVQSIDSSAPVWRGWNGFDIRDPKWDRWGRAVDFADEGLEIAASDDLILRNLEACYVNTSRLRRSSNP